MSLLVTPWTSLDRIFVKLKRDTGITIGTDIDEADAIEWAGEALEAIGAVTQYEEAVCFLIVQNGQTEVPKGLKSIIQIANNYCWQPDLPSESSVTPQDVINGMAIVPGQLLGAGIPPSIPGNIPAGFPQPQNSNAATSYSISPSDPGPAIPVALDCNGEPLNDYDLAYYRPYFDLQYEYSPWTSSQLYQNCFQPVHLTDHSFFSSIVCQENNYEALYQNYQDEYNIYQGNIMRFSFTTGQIAISYRRISVDKETGYPLVPDEISYLQAIVAYITWKFMSRKYYANREGSDARYAQSGADWQWYCKQAGNKALMIEGLDEHQNYLQQRAYMIPNNNKYYGFFGKLSQRENRRFDNPNRSRYYFRGQ